MNLRINVALLSLNLVLVLLPLDLFAKDVLLYSHNSAVPDYQSAVSSIEPGDFLVFSNDRRIEVIKKLGERSNLIFEIPEGKAIRISTEPFEEQGLQAFKAAHVNQYKILKDSGVKVVRVFTDESVPLEFTIVKKEDVKFTLEEYFSNNPSKTKLFANNEIDRKLLEFARSTSNMKKIGDFNPSQIAWNGNEWVLLDWDEHCEALDPKDPIDSVTAFTSWKYKSFGGGIKYTVPEEVYNQILHAVNDERQESLIHLIIDLRALNRGILVPSISCEFGPTQPFQRLNFMELPEDQPVLLYDVNR